MGTQCEFLDTEPLAATESPAIVPLQGEWRYALGGTLSICRATQCVRGVARCGTSPKVSDHGTLSLRLIGRSRRR